MSQTMADRKPKPAKKKQSGHVVRIPDEHFDRLKERADAEERTVPQLLKLAIDAYFRNNPEPMPPPK